MKVYVAVFIHQGVLSDLEVYADQELANAKADDWKKEANEEEDVVDVLEKEVISPRTPLRELGLPKLVYLRLKQRGYHTVEQLCETSEWHLLGERLIGPKCVSAVKEALSARGLSLAED